MITTNHFIKTKYVTATALDSLRAYLESKHIKFIDYVYEMHGMYRQLHMHAIVQYNGLYKPLTKFANFKLHWARIDDLDGATNYIHKYVYNKDTQQQTINENHYKLHRFNAVAPCKELTVSKSPPPTD